MRGSVLWLASAGATLIGPAPTFAQISGTQVSAQPSDIVITAQKPATAVEIDRKVYKVTGDLQAATGTAADVLNNVPSVSVDVDGNVSLRGDTNVTILVDGKPSAQFNNAARGLSILSLSASDIDHVEVMTTPPAQYKSEGAAGVINIVTKRTRKPGAAGQLRINLGDDQRGNAGLDADYNAGPLKLHGGVSYRQDFKVRISTDDRDAIDPSSGDRVASAQRIDEHFLRRTPSVNLRAEDALSPKQTLGVSVSHREMTGKRFFDQDDMSGPSLASIDSLSARHSDGHEWNQDASEGVTFEQQLRSKDETINLSLQRSATRERERYFYTNTYTLPAAPVDFDTLNLSMDLIQTEFSADYALKTKDGLELKAGYDLEDNRNAFDDGGDLSAAGSAGLAPNPALTNHFRYHQQVDAAYGDARTPFGAWTLDAGLRIEGAHAETFQEIGAVAGRRNDFGAYPSLHLERTLNPSQSIFVSLARRITRPDPEALNPFVDTQDTHNLRQGNPNLLPQDTWTYEAGYQFAKHGRSYGGGLYYRFDRDQVTDVIRPVGADVVLATKTNLPKSRSAGAEFNASGHLTKALSYTVSGEAFYAQIDATALGFPGIRSTTGVNLKSSLDYRPTKADLFQLSFTRADARLTPQGEIAALDLVNLGYKRTLSDRLSLVATLSDALDGQRYIRSIATTSLTDRYERHQLGRIAFIGLTYAFGGETKQKKPAFEYDK